MQLLTEQQKQSLPRIYSQENVPDPVVQMHFFIAGWDWYVTEFDGDDEFFGFVVGLEPELGYFSLSELETLKLQQQIIACDDPSDGGFRKLTIEMNVERDEHWRPLPLSEVKKRHGL